MADYLADSYALVAHLKDAPPYRPYFDEADLAITSMHLVEVGYWLIKEDREAEMNDALGALHPLVVDPPARVAHEAARFRRSMVRSGADCSYVDAWGYATAQWLGIPFLTGDDDFRKVPGVEFVKA